MITKDEIQELLHSTETYRVERTTSTDENRKAISLEQVPLVLANGRLLSLTIVLLRLCS